MARKKKSKLNFETRKNLSVRFDQDVSDHATELLWGQGFNVTHALPKANERINELIVYNDAKEQFSYNEKLLSLLGNTYMTIDMVNGNPTWTIADPYLNSTGMAGAVGPNTVPNTAGSIYGMGRALVTDMVAVIWKRITYGTISFPIKEVWDNKRVKRYFYGEQNKTVKVAEVNKQIPEEMQLQEEWVHDMGFVPVIWFKNVPVYNSLSYKDGYKGADIMELANHTLSQQWYETGANRTRLFGSMNEEKYAEIVKSGSLGSMVTQDLLVNVPQRNSTGGEDNALVPIQGDPKLEVYSKAYKALKDEYFTLAGYSPLGDGTTEKTATENLLMKTGDYQTTKKKRNLRYAEICKLLDYTMKIDAKWGYGDIYGTDESALTFEIMENKVMDSLQEVANIKNLVDSGFMSKIEAIKEIRGITLDEATTVFENILKEQAMYAEVEEEDEDNKETEE